MARISGAELSIEYHVWSRGFVLERTYDGQPIKLMVVIDEYTRECLAVHVAGVSGVKMRLMYSPT